MAYAQDTKVSSAQSRADIERTLERYGAGRFLYGWDENNAVVGFTMADRQIKFCLPMPDKNDREFTHTEARGSKRSDAERNKKYEQAVRQKWRALLLVIKAKLEAVESGITVFDDEFMAHIVMPDGNVLGNIMKPQIESAYSTGKMPPLLPKY